jgi:hypothetical protein
MSKMKELATKTFLVGKLEKNMVLHSRSLPDSSWDNWLDFLKIAVFRFSIERM